MTIWRETPVDELGLSTQAPRFLAEAGITTVGHLLEHSREQLAEIQGMGAARLRDLDDALTRHGLDYQLKLPSRAATVGAVCTSCPTCETCGNPRATDARSVVIDMRGDVCHMGFREQPPCRECQDHHRELVVVAARRLAPVRPDGDGPNPEAAPPRRSAGRGRRKTGAA